MIRKLKYFNNIDSIKEVMGHNDERYNDITKNFKTRKDELIVNSTESVNYFELLLIKNNIYYIKEKCFFSECADLFYADFYIPRLRLTIEIDGGYHNNESRKYLDKVKENFLIERNILTIRFKNEDVFKLSNLSLELLKHKSSIFLKDKTETVRKEWIKKVLKSKTNCIYKLKNQYRKELKEVDININVIMYSKDNKWVFDNIFDLHFSTEFKFKDILKRINIYNKRFKYNIKYLQD